MGLLLVASCGKKGEAKSQIKDFTKEYMNAPGEYRWSIDKIDSTKYVSEEKIMKMREAGGPAGVYKSGIKYAEGNVPKTLVYVQTTFTHESDSTKNHTETFYFDTEMNRIVAFK